MPATSRNWQSCRSTRKTIATIAELAVKNADLAKQARPILTKLAKLLDNLPDSLPKELRKQLDELRDLTNDALKKTEPQEALDGYKHGGDVVNGGVIPPNQAAGKAGSNPAVQKAANRGSSLHADKPGNLPDQLRKKYPETEFEFTKPGVAGQDVKVKGGKHPSDYEGSTWPKGVDRGDFKPDTPGGKKTFKSDQKNKWPEDTQMLPYDPKAGSLR